MLVVLLSVNLLSANSPIIFDSHKSKGALDAGLLKQLKSIFNLAAFIETGTYNGATTQCASSIFSEIHTIELYPSMAHAAKRKFSNQSHIRVYEGSSPDVFNKILPGLKNKGTLLFFLDAHYCGVGTAVDKEGDAHCDGITAVRKEIKAIEKAGIKDCVILIDDIRGFGSTIEGKRFLGCWAYPTLKEVCIGLSKINENFDFFLLGDVLLAYDSSKYTVPLSPVVKACTISRLYDGSNYTQKELIAAEIVISHARGKEKQFIHELYRMMSPYQDPEFHYHLWSGLLCRTANMHSDAVKRFDQVIKRGYNHDRIHTYIQSIS